MDDLYRELIIDRYQNPHFRGELDPNDITYADDNPLCGDHIRIDIRVNENDQVTEAAFSGQGCSISQASADLLVESIIGKSLVDLKGMEKGDILVCHGTDPGWTLAFSLVSGVVAQTGGAIAHFSCLSREYGIPAVSLPGAMKLIEDGSMITVNGGTGEIRLASE